ncbi:MAG: electron transfer flavoprotein subunit beta/FixA family protein, partial [Lachnospiraceae bacterium]|nr:electron transfer flavoprotein subunit beta/FixA family protein [Lachnospiraceae bacterium]
MKIVVCVKQVPDTAGGVKFNPDGTLDRGAMLTIMNPDDKAGLEAALRLKDQYGAEVTVVTMGLPKAEEVLREAMAMGADKGVLVTDRVLGGADTWATSTTLAGAIRNLEYDLIITGRQAIDGDTAQVGPQIAEKLGIPQVTYAEEILGVKDGKVTVRRRLEHGVETVVAPLPCVVTVNGSAAECRPRNARRLMKYKYAVSPSEKAKLSAEDQAFVDARPYLNIEEWSAAYVDADPEQIGLAGSPTKVKAIENVVFTAKESRRLDNN